MHIAQLVTTRSSESSANTPPIHMYTNTAIALAVARLGAGFGRRGAVAGRGSGYRLT